MTPTSADGAGDGWPADPEARLARLVHDLRTPLTIASGFADLLQRRTSLTDAQRTEFTDRMVEATQELREILDSERSDRRG